mmetsp:Transcript_22098/g.45424  ORF Transcript_22098/g.45424 Transcript_22098/m.45424 type:complete len:243 (-) Transcript_22098:103-831(-)
MVGEYVNDAGDKGEDGGDDDDDDDDGASIPALESSSFIFAISLSSPCSSCFIWPPLLLALLLILLLPSSTIVSGLFKNGNSDGLAAALPSSLPSQGERGDGGDRYPVNPDAAAPAAAGGCGDVSPDTTIAPAVPVPVPAAAAAAADFKGGALVDAFFKGVVSIRVAEGLFMSLEYDNTDDNADNCNDVENDRLETGVTLRGVLSAELCLFLLPFLAPPGVVGVCQARACNDSSTSSSSPSLR